MVDVGLEGREFVPQVRLPSHIGELDGIRAIAIWMVLVLHVFVPDEESSRALAGFPRSLLLIMGHGWLGVDLFFVLSGFLITGILLESRDNPHYIRNFYGRRALRILPLYFVCIGVMACFYHGSAPYFLLSLIFMANMNNVFGIAAPHGPGVFWSLAVEEHFYFVWPWLVRLLSRRVLSSVCAIIVVAEPLLRAVFAARGVDVPVVLVPLRRPRFGRAAGHLVPFAVGIEAAIVSARGACIVACLVVTAAALPFGVMSKTVAGMALRGTQAMLVFNALTLVAIAARSTGLTAPLRASFARLTGELSYCLYLIHLALWDAYMAVFRRFVPEGFTLSQLMRRAVVVLAVSYGLALLSRRFLERPFLSLKRYLSDGMIRVRAAPVTEAQVE